MKNAFVVKLASKTPPSEFLLFRAGENPTSKGTFLFDDVAAKSCMDSFRAHGCDLPVDLEHQMLDGSPSPDPTARDARGWFGLVVRNGDLWATNVRWTPDGESRLRDKRQRYVSPTFTVDNEGRVIEIHNCAITSMPATRHAPALVAASRHHATGDNQITMPTLNDALAALEAGDTATALEILKALTEAEAETPEVVAASARLLKLTGATSLAGVAAEFKSLAKERQELAKERDAFVAAERIRLCAKLVVEAGHAPAQVWDQSAHKLGTTPVPLPIYSRLNLAELRAHVEGEVAMLGKSPRRPWRGLGQPPVPPTEVGVGELSERERSMCRAKGLDPKAYLESKSRNAGTAAK